jgi:DNA-directed RNA polymerase subunit M/transcription elongation factor TFIIS
MSLFNFSTNKVLINPNSSILPSTINNNQNNGNFFPPQLNSNVSMPQKQLTNNMQTMNNIFAPVQTNNQQNKLTIPLFQATINQPLANNQILKTPNFPVNNQQTLFQPQQNNQQTLFQPQQNNQQTLFQPQQNNQQALFQPQQNNPQTLFQPQQNNQQALFQPQQNNPQALFQPQQNNPQVLFQPQQNNPQVLFPPINQQSNQQNNQQTLFPPINQQSNQQNNQQVLFPPINQQSNQQNNQVLILPQFLPIKPINNTLPQPTFNIGNNQQPNNTQATFNINNGSSQFNTQQGAVFNIITPTANVMELFLSVVNNPQLAQQLFNIKVNGKPLFSSSIDKTTTINEKDIAYELIALAKDKTEEETLAYVKDFPEIFKADFVLESPLLEKSRSRLELEDQLQTEKKTVKKGLIACPKCGSKETIATFKQKRSADEGMDVDIECTVCG